MYGFALMILAAFLALYNNIWNFTKANRYLANCSNIPKIDKNQSLINKIFVVSIFEWKKSKRKFVYYSELIIYVLTALQIPWLIFVYCKNWYLIREIYMYHFMVCFLIAEIPSMIYAILIKSYERKVERIKKQR